MGSGAGLQQCGRPVGAVPLHDAGLPSCPFPTPSPVLVQRMMLRARYAISGTDMPYRDMRANLFGPLPLEQKEFRAIAKCSGTELGSDCTGMITGVLLLLCGGTRSSGTAVLGRRY
eukprot:3492479-Rhodomonas_salina.1